MGFSGIYGKVMGVEMDMIHYLRRERIGARGIHIPC